MIDGVRYSIPGDYALVDADGTLTLLGRGSVCINTGGEKVFPEEVEEVLKEHPAIHDAAVVGVPDERFGEAVTAVVEPDPGEVVDEAEVIVYELQPGAAVDAGEHHRVGQQREFLLALRLAAPSTSIAGRSSTRRGRGA